jgi:hypothetical protein
MVDHFVRSLIYNTGVTNNAKMSAIMKMMFEFWGFAINGTSSLTNPGGFAATTPSTMPGNFNGVLTTIAGGSNGQTLPQAAIAVNSTTGFPAGPGTIYIFTSTGTQIVSYTSTSGGNTFTGCSGGTGVMTTGKNVTSSSLLTIGNDGYTNLSTQFRYDGYTPFFAPSGPFNSSMVGKLLTAWIPGSNNAEDGLYSIISFISNTEIIININNGGVPSAPDGYKPHTVGRSNINYRVTDVNQAATNPAPADGNYYVLQLNPVNVNVGQANSQVQLTQAATNLSMTAVMSPGGTWNGSAFTDGTSVINGGQLIVNGNGTGRFEINMWGDIDYLIFETTWESQSGSASMHLEIPTRLYPQANDPNPITMCLNAQFIPKFFTSSNTIGWSGGFFMKCNDGVTRTHRTLVKALIGDGNAGNTTPNVAQPPGNTLTDVRAGVNGTTGNVLNSNAVLCLPAVAGQFSLARVLMRKMRIANTIMPFMYRFVSNGDFILLQQGLALPWDKTVLPYSILPF